MSSTGYGLETLNLMGDKPIASGKIGDLTLYDIKEDKKHRV
jgi:hypothetical protein